VSCEGEILSFFTQYMMIREQEADLLTDELKIGHAFFWAM
jgi:hypothetical protein